MMRRLLASAVVAASIVACRDHTYDKGWAESKAGPRDEVVFQVTSDPADAAPTVDILYMIGDSTYRLTRVPLPWRETFKRVPAGTYMAISTQNDKTDRCLDVTITHNDEMTNLKAHGCGPLVPLMVKGRR